MEQNATQTDSIRLAKETLETCIFNLSSVSNSDSTSNLQLIGQTLNDLTRAEKILLDLMFTLHSNRIYSPPKVRKSKSTDQAEACEPCDEPVTSQTFNEKDEMSTEKTEACEPCDEPVASQTFDEKDEMSKDLGSIPSKEVKLKYEYKEDQWSPINRKGKKEYDRNFLLMLQNDPLSIERPPNLPLMDIVKDRSLPLMQKPSSNQPNVWMPGFIKIVSSRQKKTSRDGHDGRENKHPTMPPPKNIAAKIGKRELHQATDKAEACQDSDEKVVMNKDLGLIPTETKINLEYEEGR